MLECELRLLLLSQKDHELKIYGRPGSVASGTGGVQGLAYPRALLRPEMLQHDATVALLNEVFPKHEKIINRWVGSPRFKGRIVDVLDLPMGSTPGDAPGRVVVARAVAVPPELAVHGSDWVGFEEILAQEPKHQAHFGDIEITHTCLYKLREWTRYTSLVFELLPEVFSIQELRSAMIDLARVEIDPGNFHRRLKKLDILRPLGSGQRVHRWEFLWDRSAVLRAEGIIPS